MIDDASRQLKPAFLAALVLAACSSSARADFVATFEDLSLPPESQWIGSDGSGGFASGGLQFNNSFADYGTFTYFDGWAYSNRTDTGTTGPDGQYTAYSGGGSGGGYDGSANYGIAYAASSLGFGLTPTITLPGPPVGVYVTNNAYTYHAMLNGDAFSKKFGGVSGDDPDWFLLTITGKNSGGSTTGAVPFYLADYQSADNTQDHVITDWTWVDLSGLGNDTVQLEFSLTSSDTGTFGMNTPAYFAIDSPAATPEPGSLALCLVGCGVMCGFILRTRRRRQRGAGQRAAEREETGTLPPVVGQRRVT